MNIIETNMDRAAAEHGINIAGMSIDEAHRALMADTCARAETARRADPAFVGYHGQPDERPWPQQPTNDIRWRVAHTDNYWDN